MNFAGPDNELQRFNAFDSTKCDSSRRSKSDLKMHQNLNHAQCVLAILWHINDS